MTRRDQTHKWFVYALALIPVWLLDEFVLNRIPLFGVIPMLLPWRGGGGRAGGSVAGAGFGMAVGILWELAYPALRRPGLWHDVGRDAHRLHCPVCPEPVLCQLPAVLCRSPVHD